MSELEDLHSHLGTAYKDSFRGILQLEKSTGVFTEFPETLEKGLREILIKDGITKLYSHQAESFQSITEGRDTLLVSRTASGKTLSFLLPILNEYVKSSKKFATLLLYPTKALSRDQESTLGKLLEKSVHTKFGTYDGDTPREERENLLKTGDFIITNPDMLHSGILPNHNRKWKHILSRLKYIVVDEVHTYRGAFGSHVSNVFRRLIRLCSFHGSTPLFICSSATIGNPEEHARALFHRDFTVIGKDGSPSSKKSIYFMNPQMVVNEFGSSFRKGSSSITIPLIRYAAHRNIRTICFCRARQEVERLYHAVTDGNFELKKKVKLYRGGLLPNERRQLEKDLFSGKINTIITTNALELGIDIGDMNLCILSGHPGSVSSFWQQAGRVGRKGNDSMIVFVAKDMPIDQYIIHHKEFVTDTPSEQAWLSADNPYILLQHIPCAAYESPLSLSETLFDTEVYQFAVQTLVDDKTLKEYREFYRYALEAYPAKGVNLRGMTDYNIQIVHEGVVIGEIDPLGAMGTLYKDAIYQHMGNRFISMDLDLEKKICTVEKINSEYYTEASWESMVEMQEVEETKAIWDAEAKFGYIKVVRQPKLYKKIKEKTYENIGYGPITLPPFTYDTTGFSLSIPELWAKEIEKVDKRYLDTALYSLSYVLKMTSPSIFMGDTNDIHTDVAINETADRWKSVLYLFDAHEGGIGFSEKIFQKINDAFTLAYQILSECECLAGCPSCVPPLPPGIHKEDVVELLYESNGAVESVKSLLQYYLHGMYVIMNIKSFPISSVVPVVPEPDPELKKLQDRLKRSAEILRNKREKKHL
jgi:DEAD/DEAH box helicase domain-containing protein